MPRKFIYDGREFPDPGEHMEPDEVRTSMVTFFPELSNASIKGPRTEGDFQVYEFERRVGTKGEWVQFATWPPPVTPLEINIDDKDPVVEVTLSEEDYEALKKKASEARMTPIDLVAKILREWEPGR